MAVGPQAQGTEVLGGDAEHRKAGKITVTVKSYHWMWVWTSRLLLFPFYRSGNKSLEGAQGLARKQPIRKQLGLEVRLVWRAGAKGAHSWVRV